MTVTESNVPNELGVPSVDNSNVVVSEPAHTGTDEPAQTPPPAADPAPDAVADATPQADDKTPDTPAEPETPPAAEPPAAEPTPEQPNIMELLAKTKYEATDQQLDIFDEYGNVDPTKFSTFMSQNNQQIFTKAVEAVNAKAQAEQFEAQAWDTVHTEYPEIKEHEGLDRALRGARIQDLASGGDGDLTRLAKDLVAPLRDSRVKAIEDVNRSVKEQEALQTAVPQNATPERAPVPLMTQLNQAVAKGDAEAATRIRHAIRKERIYGKSDNGK